MGTGFIDWTGKELHLYIFKKRSGNYSLEETKSLPLENELDQSSISSLVKGNFENVCLSLPISILSLREMSFPFSDRKKIKETIAYELEGTLLGNVNDYSIDYMITGTAENAAKVLAVCIEKRRLREIIDIFSSSGLEPKLITSIDLRLTGGDSVKLLKGSIADTEIRAEAARKDLSEQSINLRQDDLAYKKDIEETRKTLQLSAFLLLILLLMFLTNTMITFSSLKKEQKSLSKNIQIVYQTAFPEDKKVVDAVRQFKGNINTLKKKNAVLGGTPVLDILQSIANLKNKNITLHEFSADENNITVKGSAASFEEVESFKTALSSGFENAKVSESSASADKKINFTIIMKEKAI
ncbi:MAG: PilN domain-containing protein [Nitrospirae bacterium]|nr:PilN domain-containing protein [Nitrospirota bacterium]